MPRSTALPATSTINSARLVHFRRAACAARHHRGSDILELWQFGPLFTLWIRGFQLPALAAAGSNAMGKAGLRPRLRPTEAVRTDDLRRETKAR